MPKIVERTAKAIKRKGKVRNAWAVAVRSLQRKGYLKKGTMKLTAKGRRAS
jgi:hypothetical protein